MTKADLIDLMAVEAGITKAAAAKALEAYVGAVTKELKATGKLSLVGFGTFTCIERKPRMGRNPKTGESIQIAAKKTVKFKAGKDFHEMINL